MLKPKDIEIVNILTDNARLSFREIAKKAGISVVTVINKVKELERQGVLKGYTAEIDYEKSGYDVQAIIHLQISKGKLLEVETKIAVHPGVFAVYDTTGNFDAIIVAKFKSRKSLDAFLKKIQTYDFVQRTETQLILNTIKERNVRME
ncbi:MAG: Lrp/AsnC family transcriptional regulator [Nanoarchaeota archaeon]